MPAASLTLPDRKRLEVARALALLGPRSGAGRRAQAFEEDRDDPHPVVHAVLGLGIDFDQDAAEQAGLTVVGVPSGDFNQESADDKAVKDFCETRFGIDFPLAGFARGDRGYSL